MSTNRVRVAGEMSAVRVLISVLPPFHVATCLSVFCSVIFKLVRESPPSLLRLTISLPPVSSHTHPSHTHTLLHTHTMSQQNEVMAGELEPEDYEAGSEREKAQKVRWCQHVAA